MTLKEILVELEIIEGTLDDAFYSLPEYNANEDSRSYVDSARNELYGLKDNLEKAILDGADLTVSYEVKN
jgi:hypothetical protein|tara:strand:+ start:203 stop:412 length:210 start_codon:yes stop_codon:yes gene_type:complete